MYSTEENRDLKEKLGSYIQKRRSYIREKLNELPKELSDELKEEYLSAEETIEDSKVLELEKERIALGNDFIKINKEVNDNISNMKNIFAEEQSIIEENGPFRTEEELDDFYAKYMMKKVEANSKIEEAKKRRKIIENKFLFAESKKVNLPVDDYEKIINRINKREELEKFFKRLGLNDLVDKRNKALSISKEQLQKQKKLVKDKLVDERSEQLKRSAYKPLPNNKVIKELTPKKESIEEVVKKRVEEIPVVEKYGYKTSIT